MVVANWSQGAQTFADRGWWLARGVFGADEVAELEGEFDRIVDQLIASGEDINARWDSAGDDAAATQVLHTHNVQNYSARWMQALQQERFLDATEALIGPDIVLHHSKLFQKPPGHGSPFPMHQDWRYFPTANDSMIAAVIHLTPATIDMGCVRAYDGSHTIGRRPSTSGNVKWDDPHAYQEFTQEYPLDRATPVEADPGDVLFFSYFTVHGSGPNVSDATRKTVLTQLYSGRDELDPTSAHAVTGQVLRGWNHGARRSTYFSTE